MIKSARFKNFQSWEDISINFTEGLNIITGATDSGKTTLLRGLRWLHSAKPNGFSFISHWCKHGDKVEGLIEYDNGTLERKKSKSKNTWWVNGLELNATGVNVPEEAEKLSNWGEVNYSPQHEPIFLLTESEGKVAKRLNELVNLDIIDRTISNISKVGKGISSDIKNKADLVEDLDKQLSHYSELKNAEKECLKVERLEQKYFSLEDRKESLESKVELILNLEDEIEGFADISKTIEEIESLLSSLETIEKTKDKKGELESSLMSFNVLYNEVAKSKDVDKAFAEVVSLISSANTIEENKKELTSLKTSLDNVVVKHNALQSYSEVDKATLDVIEIIKVKEVVEGRKVVLNNLNGALNGFLNTNKKVQRLKDVSAADIHLSSLFSHLDGMSVKEKEKCNLVSSLGIISHYKKKEKTLIEQLLVLEETFKQAMGNKCPLCESEL